MSEAVTIARPYAKAVFEYALEKDELKLWSLVLKNLGMVICNNTAREFITNPNIDETDQVEFLLSFSKDADKLNEFVKNFLTLLTQNKRLLLLPEIYQRYEILRSEYEKKLNVQIISFAPLDDSQQQQLVNSLEKKLKRQITLSIKVNPELLGGLVVKAGDLVIDGSVQGQLDKLARTLAA